jgi:hypothetical protein
LPTRPDSRVTLPDGSHTDYSYQGNTVTYDILNHLTQVSMPRGSNTQTRTFNYIDPATNQPGAFLRNALFGPHHFNADASLNKNFRITERLGAQFRAELFNAFNHVNFGQPNGQVDSPTAGRITSLATLSQMRRWQFGLRLAF